MTNKGQNPTNRFAHEGSPIQYNPTNWSSQEDNPKQQLYLFFILNTLDLKKYIKYSLNHKYFVI